MKTLILIFLFIISLKAQSSEFILSFGGYMSSANPGYKYFKTSDDRYFKTSNDKYLTVNSTPVVLNIPTYDGSGQAVHPDVIYTSTSFAGYNYLMAMTPFPAADETLENPSLLGSGDGINWFAIGTNPKVEKPAGRKWNSDTDILFNASQDSIYMYYREFEREELPDLDLIGIKILRNVTADGMSWTATDTVFQIYDVAGVSYDWLSPSVLYDPDNSKYFMWTVDFNSSPNSLYKYSSLDGINFSDSILCSGLSLPWHQDVRKINGRYEMIANRGYGNDSLMFAYSTDGIAWTESLLFTKKYDYEDFTIYRGTFVNHPDLDGKIQMWYSAADSVNGTWSIIYSVGHYNTAQRIKVYHR